MSYTCARLWRHRYLAGAVMAALAAACGGGSSAVPGSDADSDAAIPVEAGGADAGTDGSLSGRSADGALVIVHIATPSPKMIQNPAENETDATDIIAVVTDADGQDAIAGGTLEDADGTTYGAFGTTATKGTYQAGVTFKAMNATKPVSFGRAGGSHEFIARFFDNQGREARKAITIALGCRLERDDKTPGPMGGECGGVCKDVMNDDAACGDTCIDCGAASASKCVAGACYQTYRGGVCNATPSTSNEDCTATCSSFGPYHCNGLYAYSAPSCGGPGISWEGGACGPMHTMVASGPPLVSAACNCKLNK